MLVGSWNAGGLDEEVVLEVAKSPEQIVQLGPGRQVRQSRRRLASGGKEYLVRVIVDTGTDRDSIVTAYRSSKIEKYWRGS